MPTRAIRLSLLLLAVALVAPLTAARADDDDDAETFLRDIGEAVYAFAWPTATYEGFRFDDLRPNPNGGADLVFVVHGTSAFSGGPLWTEVVLTMKDWEITNLRWGRNNALLMPPGATVEALGQMLVELNREAEPPRPQAPATPVAPAAPATLSQAWTLVDGCADGVGVRARFWDLTEGRDRLVWPEPGQVYQLSPGQSRTFPLNVRPGAKICYGAAPDRAGSTLYWGVGVDGDYGCDKCCYQAESPNVTFTLECG